MKFQRLQLKSSATGNRLKIERVGRSWPKKV